MWKNFFLGSFLGLLALHFLASGTEIRASEPLSPAQEAALFSLADLGSLDLAPKRVTVEVFVSSQPELASFHLLFPQAWPAVLAFYAKMGVLLEMVKGQPAPGELAPGKRLRLEALSHGEWLDRTYQAFQVEPPFRSRFRMVCQDKYAFAHLHLSTVHVDFRHFEKDILGKRPKEAKNNPEKLANLIIHELGHLVGLYHAHEFVNDPIPEYLPDGKTPNFMSHYLTKPGGLGFVDFQKRLVHSFLSGGKLFQQYRQVDYDPLRHLELLKRYNNYQEPKS
jgi:hypothetical protein